MILVTVGLQLPFDRMVQTVDMWAARAARRDVFAQIGFGASKPHHIQWTEYIDPRAFHQKVKEAELLIAHAGIGSVITALKYRKPIIIMPRRVDLGEVRNDHQMATAAHLTKLVHVTVAFDEHQLIDHLIHLNQITVVTQISDRASPTLLRMLSQFVRQDG